MAISAKNVYQVKTTRIYLVAKATQELYFFRALLK